MVNAGCSRGVPYVSLVKGLYTVIQRLTANVIIILLSSFCVSPTLSFIFFAVTVRCYVYTHSGVTDLS